MLSVFPHLTDTEFEEACACLVQVYQRLGHEQDDWTLVEVLHQFDMRYLRITKALSSPFGASVAREDENEVNEVEEDDNVGHDHTACMWKLTTVGNAPNINHH